MGNYSIKQKYLQKYCNQQLDQNAIQFCYFPIKQNSSFIIYSIYALTIMVLIIITIKHTASAFKSKQLYANAIKQAYVLLIFWSILSFIEIIICLGFFFQTALKQSQNDINLNILSKFVFLWTFTSIFAFNLLIYFITIHWLQSNKVQTSNQTFEKSSVLQQSQALLMENQTYSKSQYTKNNILRIVIKLCLWVRSLLFAVWFILYCLAQNYNQIKLLAKILLLSLLIESIAIIVFLTLTLAVFNKKSNNASLYKQLQRKCIRTILPTFFRCFMLSLTLMSPYYNFESNSTLNCQIKNKLQFLPYGLMSLGGIGIYILPFAIMIKVIPPLSNRLVEAKIQNLTTNSN